MNDYCWHPVYPRVASLFGADLGQPRIVPGQPVPFSVWEQNIARPSSGAAFTTSADLPPPPAPQFSSSADLPPPPPPPSPPAQPGSSSQEPIVMPTQTITAKAPLTNLQIVTYAAIGIGVVAGVLYLTKRA